MLAFDNMAARGPRGTTPWTRYEVEVPVDSSATGIVFGVLHPGSGTAWFDSLGLEVVGPPRPRTAPPARPFEPPPRPAEDFTRLLSDAELEVFPDSSAPPENSGWATWVREHARPIRSLGAQDFTDLRFLAPLLQGKRIVQLGESGHGVREFNMIKVRLIKYLHEELGYDVLAFESSLFECDRAGRAAASLATAELMRGCIFAVWHTEEVLQLFEYVKRTQGTARPLLLTGFDVQSSTKRVTERPVFLRRIIATIDSAYAQRVYQADSAFVASGLGNYDYAREARDRLVPLYDSLAAWLRTNQRTLDPRFREDPAAPILARQTAASLAVLVEQLAAGPGGQGTEHRDRGMADNLDFILNELHPGKKVIVWGHNFHLRHGGRGGPGVPDHATALRTMGTYVAARHRSELYTIGLYMYRGSATYNNRVAYAVAPATEGSLESILHRSRWRYAFVDLSRAERSPGTEWMFRSIAAKEWGVRPQLLVPRDEYDAILFIDRTWPPSYVP
jgi:erythromycin esterase